MPGEKTRPGIGLAVLGGFALGAATVLLIVWLYQRSGGSTEAAVTPPPAVQPAPPPATDGAPRAEERSGALAPDLARRDLLVPVQGIRQDQLQNTFDDARSEGRVHQAMDIMAPRNTPVVAVEAGRIAKLFTSDQGGLTIYQFDPTETYSYYYAHLERYAPGLREGDRVARGQLLGYVGTSGNAGPDNPHLHFAIFRLNEQKNWWEGAPVNPYQVLRGGSREERAAR
ncbi:MAG TPA: M23 family metallopeptidase [Thermoanaerobaculia bacterium]|nr:M23 family metallopeptidase [Thermoanaerobaculia bacterium]